MEFTWAPQRSKYFRWEREEILLYALSVRLEKAIQKVNYIYQIIGFKPIYENRKHIYLERA